MNQKQTKVWTATLIGRELGYSRCVINGMRRGGKMPAPARYNAQPGGWAQFEWEGEEVERWIAAVKLARSYNKKDTRRLPQMTEKELWTQAFVAAIGGLAGNGRDAADVTTKAADIANNAIADYRDAMEDWVDG